MTPLPGVRAVSLRAYEIVPRNWPSPNCEARVKSCKLGVGIALEDTVVIENRLQRNYYLNAAINSIPDIAIAWAVAHYTRSDLVGFLWTFFGLQAVYFFIWAKTFAWTWILWWASGREKLIAHLHDYLVQNNFPRPPEIITGVNDYLNRIVEDPKVDQNIRAKAAFELGTLQGLVSAGRYTMAFQVRTAFEDALQRYSRRFNGAHEDPPEQPSNKPGQITITMKKQEFDTVLWLADWGLRLWIYRPDHPLRASPQLDHDRAAAYGKVLEVFERKMVPDLLMESEEDKEERFVHHENRFKDLWQWYPERYRTS
jgi:hypothetical protein